MNSNDKVEFLKKIMDNGMTTHELGLLLSSYAKMSRCINCGRLVCATKDCYRGISENYGTPEYVVLCMDDTCREKCVSCKHHIGNDFVCDENAIPWDISDEHTVNFYCSTKCYPYPMHGYTRFYK